MIYRAIIRNSKQWLKLLFVSIHINNNKNGFEDGFGRTCFAHHVLIGEGNNKNKTKLRNVKIKNVCRK